MADRETLIDLLCKAKSKAIDEILSDDISYAQQLEIEADYLIANGVTVPKRGHWIIHTSGHGKYANNWAECSECRVCGSPQWKVCPVCETLMEKHSAIKIEEVTEMDFDYAVEDDNA